MVNRVGLSIFPWRGEDRSTGSSVTLHRNFHGHLHARPWLTRERNERFSDWATNFKNKRFLVRLAPRISRVGGVKFRVSDAR